MPTLFRTALVKTFGPVMGTLMLFAGVTPSMGQNVAYSQIANERAEKIVASLQLSDAKKTQSVKQLVANQYMALNSIHTMRDKRLQEMENATDEAKGAIRADAIASAKTKQRELISSLSKTLTPEQVAAVKDGMTYNVVPLTYANYLLQLPYLTADQKDTVHRLLTEARELAMSEGSSKEKHAWFGKYKGKITNYLTKQGYDMKKESADWARRRDTTIVDTGHSRALAVGRSAPFAAMPRLQREAVKNLIIHQYQQLTEIRAVRDSSTAAINSDSSASYKEATSNAFWKDYKTKADAQRDRFVEVLKTMTSPEQADYVKDEMTGFRLQKEYDKFLALLPSLTEPQKKQVIVYLKEARDNAMNDFTGRELNAWFAKYRGRTNNYLAKEGYNLRKATEELEAKQAAAKK